MSIVRDLPPVSGSIVWAKQIDRQLTAYLRRVEDVLGKHFFFVRLCSEHLFLQRIKWKGKMSSWSVINFC
jgi:hypothetical protein